MYKKRLVLGVTIGGSSRLLDGQAAYFKQLGYEVYLISQKHFKEDVFCKKERITHLPVTIDNEINPIRDFSTLLQIIRHFKKIKPDIVNLGTPKMGLLGMVAASLLGVKKRIYTCRGLRFETETGTKRRILILMEKLTVRMAHQVIYVSPSLLKAAEKIGVCQSKKATVIGFGSSNGVNISDFDREKIVKQKRADLQREYSLENSITIGFVGRITEHKGCYELVDAFESIYNMHTSTRLIMMGHIKCNVEFEQRFRNHPGITHIPFQDDVPLYMSLFDIFVLPSWREGFPNVPIQAAAMGLPVVVSDATGSVDAVQDKVNGLIYKCRNKEQLKAAIEYYILNEDKRREHGSNGCVWAESFTQAKIWNGINEIYKL